MNILTPSAANRTSGTGSYYSSVLYLSDVRTAPRMRDGVFLPTPANAVRGRTALQAFTGVTTAETAFGLFKTDPSSRTIYAARRNDRRAMITQRRDAEYQ